MSEFLHTAAVDDDAKAIAIPRIFSESSRAKIEGKLKISNANFKKIHENASWKRSKLFVTIQSCLKSINCKHSTINLNLSGGPKPRRNDYVKRAV